MVQDDFKFYTLLRNCLMWYHNKIWSIILLHTLGKVAAVFLLEWEKWSTNLNGKRVSA